jgi:hypothetical protein
MYLFIYLHVGWTAWFARYKESTGTRIWLKNQSKKETRTETKDKALQLFLLQVSVRLFKKGII